MSSSTVSLFTSHRFSRVGTETESKEWPSLVMLTKSDELVINGKNRKMFPNPLVDRSVLFACFDGEKNMLPKLRTFRKTDSVMTFTNIFKARTHGDHNLLTGKTRSLDTSSLYMSLDLIEVAEENNQAFALTNKQCSIMLADVRDHKVATDCLPNGVAGYWVRIFGAQKNYTFHLSLWKEISKQSKLLQKQKNSDEALLKIGELSINMSNTGSLSKFERKRCKKRPPGIPQCKLIKERLEGADRIPTFLTTEKYVEIVTTLRESAGNNDKKRFQKFLLQYTAEAEVGSEIDNKEFRLFLEIEKSQLLTVQGDLMSKNILRTVVENVVSKSPNKIFLLNRSYLFLAKVHLTYGNYGVAEECLNVIQVDQKNRMSFEDVGFYYFFYAIVLMNFGKTLTRLSGNLWDESELFLHIAIENFEKSSWMVVSLMQAKITLVQLKLWRISFQKLYGNYKTIESELNQISKCSETFTKQTTCFLNIVYAELFCGLKEHKNSNDYLEKAEELAITLNLYYEKQMIDSLKKRRDDEQLNKFVNLIELENGAVDDEENNNLLSDGYFANVSNS